MSLQQNTVPSVCTTNGEAEHHVSCLLQGIGWDLPPRLAAEGDGDTPNAFASVTMKTSQRTPDGIERQR